MKGRGPLSGLVQPTNELDLPLPVLEDKPPFIPFGVRRLNRTSA